MESTSPRIVYHYTGIEGLIGILNSGVIHATDVMLKNDRSEALVGDEIVKDVTEHRVDQAQMSDYLRHWREDTLFAACFSEHPDDLQMWRSYGFDGGYAIGFHVDALVQALRPKDNRSLRVYFDKVQYDGAELRQSIRALLPTSDDDYSSPDPSDLYHWAALVKRPEWEYEQEWRLLTMHHTQCGDGNEDELCFRRGPFGMTPYIELELWKPRSTGLEKRITGAFYGAQNVINSICIGPGEYKEERERGLRALMRRAGIFPPIGERIKHSETSLRP